MRAVVRNEYGDTSVLRVEEVADPVVEPGRAIVEVAAAGVNMAEWHMMTGEPTMMRLATGLRRPKRPGLGQDVAGVVVAVGPGVESVAVGDRVFGSARASWATLASASAELLQPVPPGVSLPQAAAVPMAGYTALQALRTLSDLDGKRIAITGAGGGVGSFAVQIAAKRGAHVTAVCSASKAGFVGGLGAHEVLDYATTDPTAGAERFDGVLDFAGGLPLSAWRRVITPGGTLVLGGNERGGRLLGPLGRSLRAPLTRRLRAVTLMATTRGEDIAELAAMLDSGELRSTLSQTYTFDQAADAIQALRGSVHPGKIALIP